jgi:lipopolysaccharide transport system ATP-binding protein
MGEVLIKVEGVSKKFAKNLKKSLWYGLQDVYHGILGKTVDKRLRADEFWAVKDVSFEVRRGECLGLIGHNGAGKSTLLKILNGLIAPDEGQITMHGKVGALIELGAGFNPILTGRENIYNNGAVIGFTKAEIEAKLEAIIAFAELEEFIDMPVQNYSSGMKVRLGFAIAAQLEPDVLIIDEVLAVGDMGFVLKCFKIIDNLLPNTAIVFVSHNMPMVSRICNKIVLMSNSESRYQGFDVAKGIDLYYKSFMENVVNIIFSDNTLRFEDAYFIEKNDKFSKSINVKWRDKITILIDFNNLNLIELPYITLEFFDKEQRGVALVNHDFTHEKLKKGRFSVEFNMDNIQLSKGNYSLNLIVYMHKSLTNPILRINSILTLQVDFDQDIWHPFLLHSDFRMKT